MCGIVGYVGAAPASDFLLEGLRRLEYRGYDSAGIATIDAQRRMWVARRTGRIDALAEIVAAGAPQGTTGIGHTRWATHGAPTENNAHPHLGGDGVVAVVHNGVIENHVALRERLAAAGYEFRSQTDSEVVAHLIAESLRQIDTRGPAGSLKERLIEAVEIAVSQLQGTYGLAILFRDAPNWLMGVRLGSPLVVGIGSGVHYLASDASPLAGHTDRIVYLADHQLVLLSADALEVRHRDHGRIRHQIEALELDAADMDTGGFEHFMLKEIFDQPEALRNTMRGRLSDDDATAVFGGLNLRPQELRQVRRLLITACGTSWHASLVGEYLIEELARLPVEVEYASELRYRNPPLDPETLLFAVTQSGETADTLAALRELKRKGHPTLAICNVVGSTIAQEANGGLYLHAGPEIGVASTKAYTSQCLAMAMLALYFGRLHHLSYDQGRRMIDAMRRLPDAVEHALQTNDVARRVAERYSDANNFLYLGRQVNFPTALEGALKLKEISYIHAEGYPAAEMKHGPIALVDEHTPSVFIMPQGFVYDKVMANLEEIKARGGPVIAVTVEGDRKTARLADEVIHVPAIEDFLQPIVNIIPLQLLAYHIAVLRGCDVDKPRNLAKSVTVE